MASKARQYELVVFGATGFTGKYISEHVVKALPTNLRWAIAGRSTSKLEQVARDLRSQNEDRSAPAIEQCDLDLSNLKALAQKTSVLISSVGPFHRYGTPVVQACAESGTHYIDVTGEAPWVKEMIERFDSVAKRTNAIMIPQCGVDSVPADLLAWLMVSHTRAALNAATAELIYSVWQLKSMPSGGTLDTLISLFERYSTKEVTASMKPFALSPVGGPPRVAGAPRKSLTEKVFGVTAVPDLGCLTTNIQGPTDASQVYRSWGIFERGELYGPKFRFLAYKNARNYFLGFLEHAVIMFLMVGLLFAPFRWLIRQLVYAPGSGPSREESKRDRVEYRAIATVDNKDPSDPKRVMGKFAWEGSMYHLTGVFAAEAAITILRDDTEARKMGGGLLTPATLGVAYIERLRKAGVKMDAMVMP